MKCKYSNLCPFYRNEMPIDKELGRIHRQVYCEKSYQYCARYKVAIKCGLRNVPPDLYPYMHLQAKELFEKSFAKY